MKKAVAAHVHVRSPLLSAPVWEKVSDFTVSDFVKRVLDVLARRLAEEADAPDGEEGEQEARNDFIESEEGELLPDEDYQS